MSTEPEPQRWFFVHMQKTAGTALRDHVTGVDDAVLVGSPGPNVEHASALHVPAGHVFVGANSRPEDVHTRSYAFRTPVA